MFCLLSLPFSILLLSGVPTFINAHPAEHVHPKRACGHVVNGVGSFSNFASYTFTGTSMPDGLIASDDQIIHDRDNGAPFNHKYDKTNVQVSNGFLQIKVPGGQNPTSAQEWAISSGEVFTRDSDILYASVRTHAIFSSEPGTCQSSFFYKSNTQEVDLEYLSDPHSKANVNGRPAVHYTNQNISGGDSTTASGSVPANFNTAVHEYRIDWTSSATAFYIDGVLQKKHTVNVPSTPGTWLWNNWANGDLQWTGGPPAKDSVMKIKAIEMYYNTTSSVGSC